MIYLYIVLAVILALLLFLLFVPIHFDAAYQNKSYTLKLRFAGITFDLKRFINKQTKKKQQPKPEPIEKQEQKLVQKITDIYNKLVYIKNVYSASSKAISKGFITQNIEVSICFGTSDAALTGMLTGAIWALLYELLGLLTILSTVKEHKFNVDSVYDRYAFDVTAKATFKIRLISAIRILITVLYNLKRYKRSEN